MPTAVAVPSLRRFTPWDLGPRFAWRSRNLWPPNARFGGDLLGGPWRDRSTERSGRGYWLVMPNARPAGERFWSGVDVASCAFVVGMSARRVLVGLMGIAGWAGSYGCRFELAGRPRGYLIVGPVCSGRRRGEVTQSTSVAMPQRRWRLARCGAGRSGGHAARSGPGSSRGRGPRWSARRAAQRQRTSRPAETPRRSS